MKINLHTYLVGYWSFKSGPRGTGSFGEYEYLPGIHGELWDSVDRQCPRVLHKRSDFRINKVSVSLIEDEYNGSSTNTI
jgi:hypothetical protein